MDDPPVRILEGYRTDPSRRMRWVLIVGPAMLTFGGLVIAVSFLTHQPLRVRVDAAALGFVLVGGSAMFTMAMMHRILRDDVSVAIRTDGVVLQRWSVETLVAWDDLTLARWDASLGELVLERAGAEPVRLARSFSGVTGPELVLRIERARRRAAMGLLR